MAMIDSIRGSRTKKSPSLLWEAGMAQFADGDAALHAPPAMAAGVTDHVWSLEEIAALLD